MENGDTIRAKQPWHCPICRDSDGKHVVHVQGTVEAYCATDLMVQFDNHPNWVILDRKQAMLLSEWQLLEATKGIQSI